MSTHSCFGLRCRPTAGLVAADSDPDGWGSCDVDALTAPFVFGTGLLRCQGGLSGLAPSAASKASAHERCRGEASSAVAIYPGTSADRSFSDSSAPTGGSMVTTVFGVTLALRRAERTKPAVSPIRIERRDALV